MGRVKPLEVSSISSQLLGDLNTHHTEIAELSMLSQFSNFQLATKNILDLNFEAS